MISAVRPISGSRSGRSVSGLSSGPGFRFVHSVSGLSSGSGFRFVHSVSGLSSGSGFRSGRPASGLSSGPGFRSGRPVSGLSSVPGIHAVFSASRSAVLSGTGRTGIRAVIAAFGIRSVPGSVIYTAIDFAAAAPGSANAGIAANHRCSSCICSGVSADACCRVRTGTAIDCGSRIRRVISHGSSIFFRCFGIVFVIISDKFSRKTLRQNLISRWIPMNAVRHIFRNDISVMRIENI